MRRPACCGSVTFHVDDDALIEPVDVEWAAER